MTTSRRVRVTSPRTRAARRRRTTITGEIDAQTKLGEVYMRSLMRTQLRLGLLVLGLVAVLLAGLPVLFGLVPPLREAHLFGVPLPWLLLGVLVHPGLVASAWFYCRHAERNERDFADLVAPPTPADASLHVDASGSVGAASGRGDAALSPNAPGESTGTPRADR